METFYDEVEIEDMAFDESNNTFYYPCPCGDKFFITLDDILDGEEVARCPSCSLILKVIYDPVGFQCAWFSLFFTFSHSCFFLFYRMISNQKCLDLVA